MEVSLGIGLFVSQKIKVKSQNQLMINPLFLCTESGKSRLQCRDAKIEFANYFLTIILK